MKSCRYTLEGLDCANCAKKIEDKIANTEGFYDVNVNFSTSKLSFKTEEENEIEKIEELVHTIEPGVKVYANGSKINEKQERGINDIFRLILGVAIYFIAINLKISLELKIVFIIIAFALLLFKTAKKAIIQVVKNKVLDENTLITISAVRCMLCR